MRQRTSGRGGGVVEQAALRAKREVLKYHPRGATAHGVMHAVIQFGTPVVLSGGAPPFFCSATVFVAEREGGTSRLKFKTYPIGQTDPVGRWYFRPPARGFPGNDLIVRWSPRLFSYQLCEVTLDLVMHEPFS